jgi:hypothetical protein
MLRQKSDQTEGPRVIVACRIMEPELESIRGGSNKVEIRYVEQSMHRTPQKMAPRLQEQIDEAAPYASQIILGYGLCSNGIVGVTARQQGLIVTRAHDCIALFFGSLGAYKKAFDERPGTYYLTPGWVAEKKDPLGIMEEYIPRYGEETSLWVMEEELKHYTHIVLIDTGVADVTPLRERAKENARHFKKAYEEIKGSLEYLEKVVNGPYTGKDFFFMKPGEHVTQELYLEEALACASS